MGIPAVVVGIAAGALFLSGAAPKRVVIVADEIPAMEVLARQMIKLEGIESLIVRQNAMPKELRTYDAVIVYIHGRLEEPAEKAFLKYAEEGGRLILHHSISSGKRSNRNWFRALGVELPDGDVRQGGYKWIEGVELSVVNLAPKHFITTNKVRYPERVPYHDARGAMTQLPGITFQNSEVYLNHRLSEPRIPLLGLRYEDGQAGMLWLQHTAGWIKRLGRGEVIYFMPGHRVEEFENPVYARLITNAVIWKERGIPLPPTVRPRGGGR